MTDHELTDQDVAGIAAAGDARRASGDQGVSPRTLDVDDETSAANAVRNATGGDNAENPAPGDVHGFGVTAEQAAPGTSEEATPTQAVRIPDED